MKPLTHYFRLPIYTSFIIREIQTYTKVSKINLIYKHIKINYHILM
jgi:hypothetical protein